MKRSPLTSWRCARIACAAIVLQCHVARAEEPDFRALQKLYERHGLPSPPAKAPLVRYRSGASGFGWYSRPLTGFELGFLVRELTEKEGPTLFAGVRESRPETRDLDLSVVSAEALAAKGDDALQVDIHLHEAIPMVLQLFARGDEAMARSLWALIEADRETTNLAAKAADSDPFPEIDAELEVVRIAWSYWFNSLTGRFTDRAATMERLKALKIEYPSLDTDEVRDLIRRLELTLVPGTGKPGTPEALIDALVDACAGRGHGHFEERNGELDPLIALGFDAIPALVAHKEVREFKKIDDPMEDFKNGPGPCAASEYDRIRVCDVAAMDVAYLLGIQDRGNVRWTEPDWDAFVKRVRDEFEAKVGK